MSFMFPYTKCSLDYEYIALAKLSMQTTHNQLALPKARPLHHRTKGRIALLRLPHNPQPTFIADKNIRHPPFAAPISVVSARCVRRA